MLASMQRAIEAVLGERLGSETLGGLGGGRVARALALGERDHPGDDGGGEQHADAGEQRAQAPVGAPLALGLALARSLAFLEKRALELVQLRVVARRPVERRGKSGASIELGGVVFRAVPLGGRVDQVLVQAPALGVLLQPAPQPRPLAQQRLVGDLDRVLVDGDEPALGQHRERAGRILVALDLELGERAPAGAPGADSSASANRSRIALARSRSGSLNRR